MLCFLVVSIKQERIIKSYLILTLYQSHSVQMDSKLGRTNYLVVDQRPDYYTAVSFRPSLRFQQQPSVTF